MFGRIRNFLYRHRRKFYIGGGVVGGLVLLSKYAEYKIFQWHDRQTHDLIEKQKRRHHYEKTRQTANATALNLSSSITKIVCDELQVDEILQALRNKPANKLKLWEELKVQGFSKCITTIYTSALVGSVVHANLMLLGGYTYEEATKEGQHEGKITPTNQERYLSHLQNFVEKGLPSLINKIRRATDHCLQSLRLDQQISLDQLEGILREIVLLLSGESDSYLNASDDMSFKLQPWSCYITEYSNDSKSLTAEEVVFYQMTGEMVDVINGEDFTSVMQTLIQHGLNHVLDYVADFYFPASHSKREPKIVNGKNVCSENDEKLPLEGSFKYNNHFPLVKATMPVAKLIPILSDLVRPCLSPAPGHLLQFVLLNEQLENLSFNIYEAFSRSS